MTEMAGVWLPAVTPFADGAVDFASYEKLLEHSVARGIRGVFPLGTTGESPTVDDDEMERIVDCAMGVVAGRVPIFVGVGGNATRKVLRTLGGSCRPASGSPGAGEGLPRAASAPGRRPSSRRV